MTIPFTTLSRCGLQVSRVGLGLSRLHRLRSHRERRALIDAARDLGVTHFDTAPLYGDGLSEIELGRAMQGHRDGVTIATKVGLLPRRWIGALGTAGWPIHAGRALLRRAHLISWPRRSFSIRTLRESVPASLRALRTDYLDILFLHEPELAEIEANEDLLEEMNRMKKAGMIRHLGISGNFSGIVERYGSCLDVVQAPEFSWDDASPVVPDLTFSALRGPSAPDALRMALARRPHGAVIVGTTSIPHLRELACGSIAGATQTNEVSGRSSISSI